MNAPHYSQLTSVIFVSGGAIRVTPALFDAREDVIGYIEIEKPGGTTLLLSADEIEEVAGFLQSCVVKLRAINGTKKT